MEKAVGGTASAVNLGGKGVPRPAAPQLSGCGMLQAGRATNPQGRHTRYLKFTICRAVCGSQFWERQEGHREQAAMLELRGFMTQTISAIANPAAISSTTSTNPH